MRITIYSVLLGAVMGLGPVALFGCSGDVGQAADAGATDPGSADGGPSSDLTGSSNPESDPKLQGMTALQNQVRASVMPPPAMALPALTWDPTVATAAQAVANSCAFQHSNNGYGENIYAAAGSTVTPASVVDSWVSEKADYTYSSNACAGGKTCGHYTQVVWRTSLRLGCAQRTCTTGSPFTGFPTWQFWVCDYSPAGNQSGQKPY